jgi:hypothetical protein
MSTQLHKRMLAFDHGDKDENDIMEKVWAGTPWMLNVKTGSFSKGGGDQSRMAKWCRERFGDPLLPWVGRPGQWQFGNATVHGWTWLGFATEEQMQEFVAAWPGKTTEGEV